MKKLFVFALVCAAVQMSNAAYLYWQVNSDDIDKAYSDANGNWSESWNKSDINAARIYKNGEVQEVYLDESKVTAGSGYVATSLPSEALYSIDIGDLGVSSYSYFIELGNYTGSTFTAFARSGSETVAYNATGSTSIVSTLSDAGRVSAWHASTEYSAVPEPTSAILMLFGAAFLGLKRKNRSLA